MKTRRHDYSTGSSPQQAAAVTAPGRRQPQICSRPYLSRGLIRTRRRRPCFGEMLPNKRGADDLTRFSNENKRTCSGEEETHSYWDSQGIWSVFSEKDTSNLQRSVVSIALFDEHKLLFASSGIAVECQCNLTRFVTSASLASAFDVVKNRQAKVKIAVLDHEGNAAQGIIDKYDLDYGIAVVRVMSALDVYCIPLNHEVKLMPHGTEVVAAGRGTTGVLLCTRGTITGAGGSKDSGCHMFSTCKLSEVMQGGALFCCDGNFIGMNLFFDGERTIFLPRSIVLDRLKHLETSLKKGIFLAMFKSFRDRKRYTSVELTSHEGSTNVNAFEERFGDEYPTGIWSKFKEGVSSRLHDIVVALASFHGESKFFECTGFFIDYDKYPTILTSASLVRDPNGLNEIVSGLRIMVLLPNNKRRVGKLKHYSLHYNVALVSIRNYNVDCPANLKNKDISFTVKMVAVGRCFESGVLMAADGELTTNKPGEFDCDALCYSTCEITKDGIGGPLVDYYGRFVGLNYYDSHRKMGTPFLYFEDLCGILNYFKTKKTKYHAVLGGEIGHVVRDDEGPPNIWILPPSDDEEDEPED